MPTCLAILNDLSLPSSGSWLSEDDALQCLERFALMLRELSRVRRDYALVSNVPLAATPLTADGHSWPALAEPRGGRSRELWRYVQSRRNVAPYTRLDELMLPSPAEEYQHRGQVAIGLGVAVSVQQLAVSLATDAEWELSEVELDYLRLEEVNDELLERRQVVEVMNCSAIHNVAYLRERIVELALGEKYSGRDLWADHQLHFPHLRLLPRVEPQLAGLGLGSESLRQVHERLHELNDSIAEWDASMTAGPVWKSLVTLEHQQRRALCMFKDADGIERCFDTHARYTPGMGRIHFRFDPALGFASVAHIGAKL